MTTVDMGQLQLRTLLSETRLAVAACDADGELTLISPALQRLFGLGPEPHGELERPRVLGFHDADGRHPLGPEETPLARARRGEVVVDALVTTVDGCGDVTYIRCNAAPVRDADGLVVGGILLAQDVTAEHRARAEQADLRARLVTTVNHEFRTPLTTLFGHAELLTDQRDHLPLPAQRSVDAVMAAATRMRTLIHTVSDLVDLEAQTHLTSSDADLVDVAHEVAVGVGPLFWARRLNLETDLPERCPARMDAGKVRRAVVELLANAAAYGPSGSTVLLRVTGDDHSVCITVRDSGCGIPAEDRDRLVRPFERGEPTDESDGTGLGLSIVHAVAVAHGGFLSIEGNSPHGLCARMGFPRNGAVAVS